MRAKKEDIVEWHSPVIYEHPYEHGYIFVCMNMFMCVGIYMNVWIKSAYVRDRYIDGEK